MIDYEKLYKETCWAIEDLLLENKLTIKAIPQKWRIAFEGYGFYVTAFRVSRDVSIERFIEDLCLLCEDISKIETGYAHKHLFEKLFVDNVWMGRYFDEEGKKQLEVYRNGLPEDFVCGLSETNKHYWEAYRPE